jgi:outer membrane immunogenic protein
MMHISRWGSIAALALATALAGTAAHAQKPWQAEQRFAWAPFIETAPTYDWNGFYIGANGGGAWSQNRNIFVDKTFGGDPFFEGAFGTRSVQGGFGGAQVGYGSLHRRWYYGGEFDVMGGSISGRSNEIFAPFLSPGNSMTFNTRECMDFLSTLTGRVGYAVADRTLIYGLGGLAVAKTDLRFDMVNTFGFDAKSSSKAWRGGYVVGGGLEYAFTSNWSVRGEYKYIDLGNAFIGSREFSGALPTAFNISTSSRLNYSTFDVGVNYKFGGTAIATLGH